MGGSNALTLLRLALAIGLLGAAAPGCRTTPKEIERIRVENELLREQIRVVRQNCGYYRDLSIEIEEKPEPER